MFLNFYFLAYTKASVGPHTLPIDILRNLSLLSALKEYNKARDRLTPYRKSITCRHLPASANLLSGDSKLSKNF